jgi:hypothetical protein
MVDITGSLGDWIPFVPDLKVKLKDGTEFDNRRQPYGNQIRCKVKIITHAQRSSYTAMYKSVQNLQAEDVMDVKRQVIEENTSDWENLEAKGRAVISGADFYKTQGTRFINYMEAIIMSDIPLKEPVWDKETGMLIEEGDEGNLKKSWDSTRETKLQS